MLRMQRKRILSSTPPNAKKPKEKTKEGEEHMTVSPKVTQDLKKRIVEVDEDGNIKLNGESVVAGKDPSNPGHDPSKGNMADQNINKPPIRQALGVKELISTPLLNTHHPNP